MATRNFNTDKNGNSWTEETKKAVWAKAQEVLSLNKNTWRYDKCHKKVKWEDYGNRNSDYGWEIDHINPVANNGSDELENLQVLYWKNNADKSDNLSWKCPMRAPFINKR